MTTRLVHYFGLGDEPNYSHSEMVEVGDDDPTPSTPDEVLAQVVTGLSKTRRKVREPLMLLLSAMGAEVPEPKPRLLRRIFRRATI